ncbi:hypothetical protein HYDPIDRAFT_22848, partial [Hydnomerulius pinastri MD-312]
KDDADTEGSASDSDAERTGSDDQSDDDNGLDGLTQNPKKLQAALHSERPQVQKKATASVPPTSLKGKAVAKPPMSLTSPDSDVESDIEHLMMPSVSPILGVSPSPGPGQLSRPPATITTRVSARERRRQTEIPVFAAKSTLTAGALQLSVEGGNNGSDASDSDDASPDHTIVTPPPVTPTNWAADTAVSLNTRGQINIRSQLSHIQAMPRAAISLTNQRIVFDNAYPDMNNMRRSIADILYVAADQTQGCDNVRARITADSEYVRLLAGPPTGRVSKFRCSVKTVTQRHVASIYGLEKGCSKEKVNALLEKDNYIFPMDSNGNPIRSKPFQSPAVVRTLEDAFFEDETSAGIKYASLYVSTYKACPDELELPAAMVALATTAVRSVIMDFSTNGGSPELNSYASASIYERLIKFIEALFQQSPRKCHKLFSQLYDIVYGSKKACEEESGASMLMHLDLDAMDD